MALPWRQWINGMVWYTLAAVAVAWFNRESLYYLDGWVTFTSIAAVPHLSLLGCLLWQKARPDVVLRWKAGMTLCVTIIFSLATFYLVLSAVYISFIVWMTPIHNVRKYDYVSGKWNSPFTAHFPRPIPADAREVRFYFDPGALQAPSVLELGSTTTPARIDVLYREYQRRSSLAFTAGTENGIIEPSNCVGVEEQNYWEFSGDYTLFYLDEAPPTQEKDWNHPDSHGVAISRQRNRVVFWAWSG